jgi:hypothetical protein
MLSSNMLLLNLILPIAVTFSTPTPVCNNYQGAFRIAPIFPFVQYIPKSSATRLS